MPIPITPAKKRILSGIQPTGCLHLGNYLGAIQQWISLQQDYESYFCVVDLHAITVPQDRATLRKQTLQTAATYLAAGIDPAMSRIFVQSHVPAHAELTWLLHCMTPMSWLEGMIQYKEKSRKQGEAVSVGLFAYPLLMAADILLYAPDLVPVGEDQRQHLELTRDIAQRCNQLTNSSVLKLPNALIVPQGARIMSLTDGKQKMSKSTESDASRINLLDPPDVIRNKFKRCKTDSVVGLEWDNPDRPEARNLLTIYQAVTGRSREDVLEEVKGMNWGKFKPDLAEAVIAHLAPIQQRYHDVMQDEERLEGILEDGRQAADLLASQTLRKVKEAMGFALPKVKKV